MASASRATTTTAQGDGDLRMLPIITKRVACCYIGWRLRGSDRQRRAQGAIDARIITAERAGVSTQAERGLSLDRDPRLHRRSDLRLRGMQSSLPGPHSAPPRQIQLCQRYRECVMRVVVGQVMSVIPLFGLPVEFRK